MERPKPRADFLEHLWRFYNALWRWAEWDGSATFATSWTQLASATRYPLGANVLHSCQRYSELLAELGLARVSGVKDETGAWRRLDVELFEPPELVVERAFAWDVRPVTNAVRKRQRTQDEPAAGRGARRAFPRVRRPGRPWPEHTGATRTRARSGPRTLGFAVGEGRPPGVDRPERASTNVNNCVLPQGVGLSLRERPTFKGLSVRASIVDSRRTGGSDANEPTRLAPGTPTDGHELRDGPAGGMEGATGAARSDWETAGRGEGTSERCGAPSVAAWVPGDGRAPAWWLDPVWANARIARLCFVDRDAAIGAAVEARLRGADPVVLVRAFWAALHPVDPERCSRARLDQLRRALTLIETRSRGDRRAGATAAIELAVSHMVKDEFGDGPEFQTLAGIAAALHQIGRKWKRTQREHGGELPPRDGRTKRPMLPERDEGFEWPWH